MAIVYLALGSNLGDRRRYIERALDELKHKKVHISKVSTIIETDPVDSPPQNKYLNAVLKATTDILPEDLLMLAHAIEKKLGRVRKIFHGPRVIDIDILLYDDLKLVSRRLTIPHPRMMQRDFVLKPLSEIDPKLCDSLKP